ncbi:MAG: hypothetical protein ACLRNA_02945 [Gemmiger formicilis]
MGACVGALGVGQASAAASGCTVTWVGGGRAVTAGAVGTAAGASGCPPRKTVCRTSSTAARASAARPAPRSTRTWRRWRARSPVRAAKG